MRILIYITEESSVRFVIEMIQEILKQFSNTVFYGIVFTDAVRVAIKKEDKVGAFKKIISQSDTVISSNNSALSYTERDSLIRIESTYSRKSIWNYICQDRYLIMTKSGFLFKYGSKLGRNVQIRTIINRFHSVEEFVKDVKPDAILYATHDYGTSISSILWEIANYTKIPTYIPNLAKYKSHFTLNNEIHGKFKKLEIAFIEGFNNENFAIDESTKSFVNNYLNESKQAFYINRSERVTSKVILRKILSLFRLLINLIGKQNDFLAIPGFNVIKDKIIYRSRLIKLKVRPIFYNMTIENDDRYLFFPLHFEPELVLNLQSQLHTNQIEVVRNIAQSLPNNYFLYVKENPTSMGRRKLSYYKKLLKIPNVRLINGFANSIDIIKKSEGIITIIGTAGIEGFLLNKPVVTLSNAFYNFLPSIYKCDSYDQIADIVKDFRKFKPNQNEKLVFIQAIKNLSIETNLISLIRSINKNGVNDENVKQFNKYLEYLLRNIQTEKSY